MTLSNKRIVMGGEGGQGVQAAADILAQAAYEEGKEALYIPNFGIEQRGGVSLAFVQVGEEPIGSPKFKYAHLIVALSGRSLERLQGYINEESIILYDSSLLAPPQVSDEVIGWQCYDTIAPEAFAERRLTDQRQSFPEITSKVKHIYGLPASEMAQNKLHPRVANIIILGATAGVMEIVQLESTKKALETRLENKLKRDPALKNLNFRALELGWEAAARMIKRPVSTGKI
ncbi:MAG: pyruvate oxidoreductase subunit gamma [Dethiobacter sp.]|jgi:2-oxoglutarate ferredoxin oxidoreductase subunit gamma|nr:MAG: pyruvate oxidoreductase subunit gamma [Dethiobacter sp.]